MNKLRILVVVIVTFLCCQFIDVNAASANLSVSSSNVYVGDSFTVFVNMNQAAAWNVHVNSSGPVSGCVINEADSSSNALDISKQFSAKCTATQEGKINISLSGDVTSASDGIALDIFGNTVVNVNTRPIQTNNNENYKNNEQNKIEKNETNNVVKSKNCNLKSISVEGYNLEKIDANNYTLTVSNNVSSINVNAIAEDSKSTIKGIGNHVLNIGANNIEIVIVSESGKENKIVLQITRKKEMSLEELDELLKSDDKSIEINNDSNRNLSSQELSKIKSSGKTIILNHKENGILKYSWIINGKEINDFDELFTEVQFNSKKKEKISKLSNYAEGIYLSFKQSSFFPDGVKLKVYVKDKYSDGSKVNIYYYDNKKMVLHRKELNVKDGYISFDVDNKYDHFMTMSTLQLTSEKVKNGSSKLVLSIVLICTLLILIGVISIFLANKKVKDKEKKLVVEELL